jgi:4-hydroxy-3-polyprenylbenzoate decarboxylase
VWIPSFLAYPWGTEEYGIAGALLGEPLQVVTGKYTGLPIPAHAEIVIEGEYPPPEVETREEGPFGEWPGYYASGARKEPVIKVKRIMHRNNPIIVGSPPMKPPAGGTAVHVVRASNVWHELDRLGIPGIRGVWNMRAGGSRYLTVISVEQKYSGHARQVAMAAMSGEEGASHGRFVIVVDEDIDPTNDEDVLWAIATRCDPATSIEILAGCWSAPLDPGIPPERKAKGDYTNSRAIILACRPYYWKKDFPRVNRASDELRAATLKKWSYLFATK